jgi:hypothetical protein
MKILYGQKPPVWEKATTLLGADERAIFTWGDTIYVPSGDTIDAALIAHETVHSAQQGIIGVDAWWKKYFEDSSWRSSQEIPAYQAQYKVYCQTHKDRNDRARYLTRIAGFLSGKLYGQIVSFYEARLSILGGYGG